MTAKEYLTQYRLLMVKKARIEAEIIRTKTQLESISIKLDGMPRGTGLSNKTATLAAKLGDFEAELADAEIEVEMKRQEIIRTIHRLDNADHIQILELRYIDGLKWEAIAEKMHYTVRWITSLHGRALQETEKILNSSY